MKKSDYSNSCSDSEENESIEPAALDDEEAENEIAKGIQKMQPKSVGNVKNNNYQKKKVKKEPVSDEESSKEEINEKAKKENKRSEDYSSEVEPNEEKKEISGKDIPKE